MKITTKLAGTALIAALGMGAVLPQVAKADTDSLTGKGKVEFTKSSSSSTSHTNPSGGSNSGDVTDSSAGNSNSSNGEFGIDYVTNLDFEKHGIIASNASPNTYWASTWVANKGAADEVKNAHHVTFHDLRNTLDHTYEISAEITRQFNTAESPKEIKEGLELKGSTITYKEISIAPGEGFGKIDELDLTPTGLKQDVIVKFGESTPVLTNTKPAGYTEPRFNTGYGEYSLMFGKYNAVPEQDTSAKSVMLTIPRGSTNAVINEGVYHAEITWTMSETPAV